MKPGKGMKPLAVHSQTFPIICRQPKALSPAAWAPTSAQPIPRQSSRAIVPTIIAQALSSDEVHLGNTTPSRDLTYISDLVEGFLRIAQAPGVEGETFNFGTGNEISIAELAQRIIGLLGRDVEVVVADERKRPERSEVQRLLADSSRARQRFGWEPIVSLEEGLRRTIAWISENMHLYKLGSYQV